MSWSDQDIDKLFQQTKQPEIPPFQDSFWTEMETMLPEQKRKKATIWWWLGSSAVLAVLLIAGFTFNLSSSVVTKQAVALQKDKQNQSSVLTSNPPTTTYKTTASSGISSETPINHSSTHPFQGNNSFSSGGRSGSRNNFPDKLQYPTVSTKTTADEGGIEFSEIDIVANLPLIDLTFRTPFVQPQTPNPLIYKPSRFYAQVGAGVGFSSRKNVPSGSDLLNCNTLGAGLFKKIDHVVLTLGIQGRVDFVRNIRYTYFPDGTSAKRIDANYRQLYSVELPASIGITKGLNTFALNVNPGFQAGVFGELNETNNEVLVRSENTFVHVDKKATTLTMEFGCSYLRTISPEWQLGVGVNSDIIGPFNGTSYAGKERLLPVNAQFMLRKTF